MAFSSDRENRGQKKIIVKHVRNRMVDKSSYVELPDIRMSQCILGNMKFSTQQFREAYIQLMLTTFLNA